MSNLNHGTLTGRLAADPKVFVNIDGSKSVHVTLYVDRPYRDSEGHRPSDRVQLETWLRPTTEFEKTPFAYMNTGDLVALGFEVRASVYADKQTGEIRYAQVLSITDASLLESASVTTARLQKRLVAVQAAARPEAAPAATARRTARQKAAASA